MPVPPRPFEASLVSAGPESRRFRQWKTEWRVAGPVDLVVARDALQDPETTRIGLVAPSRVERTWDNTLEIFLDDDLVLEPHTSGRLAERHGVRVAGEIEGDTGCNFRGLNCAVKASSSESILSDFVGFS